MAKKSRLTKLYNALATMRRENLQTTFELAELINKINGDIYSVNPEKKPEEVDINDPGFDDLPISVQLKWALIALHRSQRQIEELKVVEKEKQELQSKLYELQSQYDKLMIRYDEKCIEAKSVKSVEWQSQLRILYVNPNARYQLFPTENRWNFINLDTQTGKMRMVQYSTESTANAFTYTLSDVSLVENESTSKPGRFTLYPTQNRFNFILLDQTDGRTWQVQWSTKAEEVGIWRIL